MFDEVIALKAYSIDHRYSRQRTSQEMTTELRMRGVGPSEQQQFASPSPKKDNPHTNLIQTTLVRENSDVSVVGCPQGNGQLLIMKSWDRVQVSSIPDMMAVTKKDDFETKSKHQGKNEIQSNKGNPQTWTREAEEEVGDGDACQQSALAGALQ